MTVDFLGGFFGFSLSRDFLQEEIQKMISDVDDDGSGTIGYEELLGKLGSPHSSLFSHRPARSRSIALSLSLHLLRATIIRLSVCLPACLSVCLSPN